MELAIITTTIEADTALVRLQLAKDVEMKPEEARALGNALLSAATEAEGDALLAATLLSAGRSRSSVQRTLDEMRPARQAQASPDPDRKN